MNALAGKPRVFSVLISVMLGASLVSCSMPSPQPPLKTKIAPTTVSTILVTGVHTSAQGEAGSTPESQTANETSTPLPTRPLEPTKTLTPNPTASIVGDSAGFVTDPDRIRKPYPAPLLKSPNNNAAFSPDDPLVLEWQAIEPLASDYHYLLVVEHRAGASWIVTDESFWVAPRWLQDFQPLDWWVMVCYGAEVNELGYDRRPSQCDPTQPRSEVRHLIWQKASEHRDPPYP